MNKLHDHLQHESEKFRMTDAEKSAMRARLLSVMGTGSSAAPAPSPYMWFFAPRMLVTSALAFLLVVTTGTTYAAGDSLPGGVLYPVKTAVLEPLAVALAPTTAAKAEANATIATRRVQEAQTLAAKGALTAETARTISDSYQVHAQAALALAKSADDDAGIVEDETVVDANVDTSSAVVAVAPAVSAEPTTMAMSTGPADEPASLPQTKSVVHLSVTATITPPASTTEVEPVAPVARSMYAAGNPENQNSSRTASSSSKATTMDSTGSLQATSTKKSLRGKLNATLSTQAKILEELQLKLDTKGSSDDE